MKGLKSLSAFVLLFIFFVPQSVLASTDLTHQIYTTNSFHDVYLFAKKFGYKYGNKNVLIVFDIDDTLLVLNSYLGSVPWWNWQEKLLHNHPHSKMLEVHSFKQLLSLQLLLYGMGRMHLVGAHMSQVIKNLQKSKFKIIALSARDDSMRSVTQRALYSNHISFSNSLIGSKKGYPGTYYPFKTKEMSKGRKISYMNGIVLSSGLNKGQILESILKKTSYSPKAILFVDDETRNVKDVGEYFKNSNIATVVIRYGKEDEFVHNFNLVKKEHVAMLWNKIKPIIKTLRMKDAGTI